MTPRFEPHFDADGNFIHPCCICGADAGLGVGVSLLKGQLGTWHCQMHKPPPSETMVDGQASNVVPMVPRPDQNALDEILRNVEAEMSARGIMRL
jgi:hypothetical protein